VTQQEWYERAYRPAIIAYAIAKLSHEVNGLNKVVDFDLVWKSQGISAQFESAITTVGKAVHGVIMNPPAGVSKNVGEWAKSQACWSRVKELSIHLPRGWFAELKSAHEQEETLRSAVKDQQMLNGIEAQTAVMKAGGELWSSIKKWGTDRSLLTPTEDGILDVASSVPKRVPSEKQSQIAIKVLRKLHAEVCQLGLDIGVCQVVEQTRPAR
jgi:hypothetical protein